MLFLTRSTSAKVSKIFSIIFPFHTTKLKKFFFSRELPDIPLQRWEFIHKFATQNVANKLLSLLQILFITGNIGKYKIDYEIE